MESDDICLICGGSTKGLHLQVSSCRACAAFFRRSIRAKKVYRCQKGTGSCDLTKRSKGKPLCRFCRMKKCASIGMNIDLCVEPYNYARPSVSSSDSLPDSVRTCLKSGSFMNQVKSCLSKEPEFLPKIGVKLTEMQRFQLGLSRLLNYSWPLKEVKVVQEIEPSDKEKIGEFFSQYFGYIAELIACSESILKLSAEERFCMYKHFWFNFIQLERIYTTCQVRGHNLNDTLLFLDNNFLVDFTAPSFSVEKMNPEEKRRFAEMNEPLVKLYYTYLVVPFKTMKVTAMELAFIAVLILWDVREVKNLSPESVSLASEVIEKVSNEMHSYYTFELRNANYAERITKLSKLANDVQRLTIERKNLSTMGEVFNLFTTDLCSASEMLNF